MEWDLSSSFVGRTAETAFFELPAQHQKVCVLLEASGGEFRIVLSKGTEETRGQHDVLCFIVGRSLNRGRCTQLGLGNPFSEDETLASTTDILPTGSMNRNMHMWFAVDMQHGWVAAGSGRIAGERLSFCVHISRCDSFSFSHLHITNWRENARVRITQPHAGPVLHRFGHKFGADGSALPYKGLTSLCLLPHTHALAHILEHAQSLIRQSSIKHYLSMLPPHSFHCTVREMIAGTPFEKSGLENRLGEFIQSLKLLLDSTEWTTFTFVASHISDDLSKIILKPLGLSLRALKAWRDRLTSLAGDAGVRLRPGSYSYEFHVSLCYELYPVGNNPELFMIRKGIVREVNEMLKQLPPVVFDWPGVYFFTDMYTFIRCDENGLIEPLPQIPHTTDTSTLPRPPALTLLTTPTLSSTPSLTPTTSVAVPNTHLRHVVFVIGCGKPSLTGGSLNDECSVRTRGGVDSLLRLMNLHITSYGLAHDRPPCILLSGGFGEAAMMANTVRDVLAEKIRLGSEEEKETLGQMYPDILVQEISSDTVDNALICARMFSRRLFDRGPLGTRTHIHLVTSNYHMPRAKMVFSAVFNPLGTEVHAVPVGDRTLVVSDTIRLQQKLTESNAERLRRTGVCVTSKNVWKTLKELDALLAQCQ